MLALDEDAIEQPITRPIKLHINPVKTYSIYILLYNKFVNANILHDLLNSY
jgi:hypothetical protein